MRLSSALLIGAMLFSDAAAKQPAADTRDVEVLGRLENLYDYEPTNLPDDLLGHGRMTAKFYVARVLRGPRLPPVVTVQYFGHFHQERKNAPEATARWRYLPCLCHHWERRVSMPLIQATD